jgi:predicted Fe-Mo cluster-binding NifX family protein
LSLNSGGDDMCIIVACATDDGKRFIDEHFGNAKFYKIYKIDKENITFIKDIINTTDEEEEGVHADPVKARGIVGILKNENVQAGVSKRFGPNIVKVKKHFVPVVLKEEFIENGLEKVKNNYNCILDLYNQGEKRKHLVLQE